MKAIHGNKLAAVTEMKLKALFSKNFIIMPVFAIGLTFVMKLVYGTVLEGEAGIFGKAYALAYGALMNICMTGIYCVSAALAEEKEKHTLRVLMTSSVNGTEFFLGILIPVILMVEAVNALLVPLAGVTMDAAGWAIYLGISLLAAIAGAVIGMIFGIFAKNQVTASTVTTPIIMVLMMVPMFSRLNEMLGTITDFLFTGIMMHTVENIVDGSRNPVSVSSLVILVGEILLAMGIFQVVYRKNGYDSE